MYKRQLPDSDYKGIEYSISLLDNIKRYENYVPEELVEESIVSLKKEDVYKRQSADLVQ